MKIFVWVTVVSESNTHKIWNQKVQSTVWMNKQLGCLEMRSRGAAAAKEPRSAQKSVMFPRSKGDPWGQQLEKLEHFVLLVLLLGLSVFLAPHPLSEMVFCTWEPTVFISRCSCEIQTWVSSAPCRWNPIVLLDQDSMRSHLPCMTL